MLQDGGGWCAYSDIFLALRQLRRVSGGRVRRFMIVDLDVHQARLCCTTAVVGLCAPLQTATGSRGYLFPAAWHVEGSPPVNMQRSLEFSQHPL